jgi:phage baseplate assembly protein W
MSDDIDQATNRAPFARHSIRLAISSILRTARDSRAELTYFSTHILDVDGRPLIGLDRTEIAKAAEAAVQTYEPLITIRAIDVEMTPVRAVAAITVHYRTAEFGDFGRVRVDFADRPSRDEE